MIDCKRILYDMYQVVGTLASSSPSPSSSQDCREVDNTRCTHCNTQQCFSTVKQKAEVAAAHKESIDGWTKKTPTQTGFVALALALALAAEICAMGLFATSVPYFVGNFVGALGERSW